MNEIILIKIYRGSSKKTDEEIFAAFSRLGLQRLQVSPTKRDPWPEFKAHEIKSDKREDLSHE